MPASSGRVLNIKYGSGSPITYTAIGGMTSGSITINSTTVDITTKDDAGIRKLLAAAGVRSVEVSGNAFFMDDAASNALITACMAQTHVPLEIVYGTSAGDKFVGLFQITSIALAGDEGGAQTFNVSFASAGAVTNTQSV